MTSSNSKLEGACITREQFLLRETRVVARLRAQGLSDNQVVSKVAAENLIQYPTDHMVRNIASVCVKRLNALSSPTLESIIVEGEPEAAAPRRSCATRSRGAGGSRSSCARWRASSSSE